VSPAEHLSGEELSALTSLVPVKFVGQPGVSFVRSFSAVMTGELNPENAKAEYFFEYGSPQALAGCSGGAIAEDCAGVARTEALESKAYRRIGATLEATGLQPGTEYEYRLSAVSENANQTEKHISVGSTLGTFTTEGQPEPVASTGGASAIGADTATISGAADPMGEATTYAFELGLYNGADTQYGTVLTGSAGAGIGPVEETFALAGLQPGTTYAYRISVQSAYVRDESHTSYGEAMLFQTMGLSGPPGPSPVAQLAFPNGLRFPQPSKPACKHGFARDKHGVCVKTKKAAKKPVKRAHVKKKKKTA
jgi:hypothetical protein